MTRAEVEEAVMRGPRSDEGGGLVTSSLRGRGSPEAAPVAAELPHSGVNLRRCP